MQRPQIFFNSSELPAGVKQVNAFDSALEELFFVENPQHKKRTPETEPLIQKFLKEKDAEGIWIYYPDDNTAVHTLAEDLYFKLRTSRNRNIIRDDEQLKYRNIKVGVAGLSVGSAIIQALVASGGPKTLKIADYDVVEITNLNRIKANLLDVGTNKTDVAAREIWRLDPFADLTLYSEGIKKENLEQFIGGDPKLDIFIDEMDSIDLKILSRFYCQSQKIPVLMATDNGDGIILDVERFDLEPERPIFHGLVDIKPEEIQAIDFKMWLKLATQIVGAEYLTERMQESLVQIGKLIPSVPQLGPTANIAGAAMAYAVRMISNGQNLPSGRYVLSLEEKLIPRYNDSANVEQRNKKTQAFKDSFGK